LYGRQVGIEGFMEFKHKIDRNKRAEVKGTEEGQSRSTGMRNKARTTRPRRRKKSKAKLLKRVDPMG